jgi:leucine dehydrogenase
MDYASSTGIPVKSGKNFHLRRDNISGSLTPEPVSMQTFQHPANDHHEGVHWFEDAASGLKAIIAIHSTHLGAAAGGCRVWRYANEEAALGDALRLSQGMSYKNALAGLAAGGGKSVILAPEGAFDRTRLFEAFGRAVASLGGQYITAEDVGSTVRDMEAAATQTRYVVGLPPKGHQAGGDPAPWTALGVFEALKRVVETRLNKPLSQTRVAIQGCGAVGMLLAGLLHEAGAQLVVADISDERTATAARLFGAEVVSVGDIHKVAADVFAPCALGGSITKVTIGELNSRIICGSANNQLATPTEGARLHDRGVIYCPDYVVNAGGIISAMAEYAGDDETLVRARVLNIPARTDEILAYSDKRNLAANLVADRMAQDLIGRAPAGALSAA